MKKILFLLPVFSLLACGNGADEADAYGNFEATEVTVSAEANGKIESLKLDEGDVLKANEQVGLIDTLQLYFAKEQLKATQNTVASKTAVVSTQEKVLQEQLKTTLIEQKRIHDMFAEKAATQRQVDEIDGKVNVLNEQITNVKTQNRPIVNEVKSVAVQVAKINDQIEKSKVVNPINGTVLAKYVEPGEVTAFGKPLYKIADVSQLTLRVYVGEKQLPQLKIGQKVNVKIDVEDGMKDYSGTISWIASNAEFTPKIIQTKEERVNLVYAVKVLVKNDGSLKIGMPAEVWLKQE
ncbi:HlyD family efflux transporter periplasmic adaptor subunit [Flavobacterium sp. NRK F10]|uniref:HlyD family secretion protein n=1 Tax=Flavobacterium sp. NRK F10 TaxID=2954931 RepID=UPI0020911560|nr:HlyD family efflux transporter periplasmic adaptor subunit [Flavobacterium sp. NRK F10]MCO6174074.1 HlyD family efflux transporter periplasmic adaptor subunit [Flavobacterium sp. NRK F10]